MDYETHLDKLFKNCKIKIYKHDTSSTGYPTYIEIELGKGYKDKGQVAKDYQNYLYRRFCLQFQTVPEYRGKGKATTLRVFQSWEDLETIKKQINEKFSKPNKPHYLPTEFMWLYVQPTK